MGISVSEIFGKSERSCEGLIFSEKSARALERPVAQRKRLAGLKMQRLLSFGARGGAAAAAAAATAAPSTADCHAQAPRLFVPRTKVILIHSANHLEKA